MVNNDSNKYLIYFFSPLKGDGGGGPNHAMIERLRRMKDLVLEAI
jgi:alpha-mannosidase